ncbi:LRRC74B [Symbiodinium sp. CCMP2592]|nr:LRRC74B [Symbiodinium sp. CCMP2592]
MAEEPQINCWEDFRDYVVRSDIRFVRPDYILRLHAEGRVFPRRQEAEAEEGALFQLDPATQAGDFKYVAVSHCWESREHPDPHGFQLKLLSAWIWICSHPEQTGITRGSRAHESQEVVFFIDYVSLYQFGNRTETQDASFRRSIEHMHLLYANSSADFCQGVLSISRLTPWWWKIDRSKAIPVFSNPAGCVQEVPLANLRPTTGGRCSEQCDASFANLHANPTPYWHRGWCRAEVEWASPAIQDISYCILSRWGSRMLPPMYLGVVFLSPGFHTWAGLYGAFGLQCLLISVLICLQDVHVLRNPGTNGSWSRSRLPLSAEEFQEQVRTRGVAFTHRSDVSQVVSLQEMVYRQKLAATKRLSLTRLARGDRHKLPGILLNNPLLTELALSATFLTEADMEALAAVLCTKELETLQLETVPLCSRSFRHLCSALRPQLRVLALSWCSLGDQQMPLLAESLGALPLEELVLSYNRISSKGAATLASALRSHPTLKCLDLSGNRLGHVGATAVAESLMPNPAMEKLVLKGTGVRLSGLHHRLRPHQEIQVTRRIFGLVAFVSLVVWIFIMCWAPSTAMLVIPPWALATILYVCCPSLPSLFDWYVDFTVYIYTLEAQSKLADWSLLFHDRLESSWAKAGEVQESSSTPLLSGSCC